MSYGNWCGPGWSAGKRKDAKDLTPEDMKVPAVNKLDQACKNHDINIFNAKNDDDIDKQFYEDTPFGLGTLFDIAVKVGGPKHAPNAERHSSKRSLPSMSRSTKRLKNGIVEIIKDDTPMMNAETDEDFGDMDDDMGEPVMAMALRSGESGGKGQIKETPITKGIPPTYTLQDTHTTIIPLIYNFSMVEVNLTEGLRMSLNCTDILNPVVFTTNIGVPTAGTGVTRGFWASPINDSTNWPATLTGMVPFGSSPSVSGHNYWKHIYEYYTVTDCHYKLKMYNMSGQYILYNGATVGQYEESFNTSTVNGRYPVSSLLRMKHMERIKWTDVNGYNFTGSSDNFNVFTGHYWPGKAKTNVRDDSEVKIWNLINANPSLTEAVNFVFFSRDGYSGSYDENQFRFNMVLEMKYVVQYKDRVAAYKFPGANLSSVSTNSSQFYAY